MWSRVIYSSFPDGVTVTPFSTDLDTRHNNADSTHTLLADLHCRIDGLDIVAPRGMTSDLATIPSIFWSFYPPFGRYTRASVIHDYLYRRGSAVNDTNLRVGQQPYWRAVNRSEADRLLRRMMQQSGCRFYTPWIFWLVVRATGWRPWYKKAVS